LSTPADKELQRLRWQCRRGLLELDYIFEHYLQNRYQSAAEDEKAAFRLLLQEQDPDLQAWLLHGQACPAIYEQISKQLHRG
jgi:antitoxin CptB